VKHHYVPACYLRAFVDPACPANYEPYLWVVDLDKGKMRRQSPENTAALNDYYAVRDGENRYDVEEYLAAVENRTAPVLAKILGDCQTLSRTTRAYSPTSRLCRLFESRSFETGSRSSSQKSLRPSTRCSPYCGLLFLSFMPRILEFRKGQLRKNVGRGGLGMRLSRSRDQAINTVGGRPSNRHTR
jgi:hypothetical protein